VKRPTVEAMPGVFITRRHVIPPAVLANRMRRYSVALMIVAFLCLALNYSTLTSAAVLWFATGVTATFALLCGVTVVVLNAIAWNFDRLRQELRGGIEATDMKKDVKT